MQAEPFSKKTSLLIPLACLAGAAFLVFIWFQNYNVVGNFYDYSIITSGCGYLRAGLHPYSDFTTPLQSFSLYLAFAAEVVFGPHYLSLAYGNLLLMLAFYTSILWTLRNSISFPLRLLTAVALCGSTVLQHGILWYNPIGMVLLVWIVWICSVWCVEGCRNFRQLAVICMLIYLSSMTKLNFHVLGMGIVLGLISLVIFRTPAGEHKPLVQAAAAILVCGLILGPLTEVVLNRTTFHDFLHNVFATPQGRLAHLFRIFSPKTYLGKVADNFPDNWSDGVFLKGALIYAGCLWFFFRSRETSATERNLSSVPLARGFMLVVLPGFYLGSLMLTVSEDEIQMLTSAFLLAGLVAVFILFQSAMSELQNTIFKFGIFLLAAYFAIAGNATAFLHSRLRWNEPSIIGQMTQNFRKNRGLLGIKSVFPLYSADRISPQLDNYFHGVYFTESEYKVLKQLFAALDTNHVPSESNQVYWGPGLEFMNRVYGTNAPAHFPLWYDYNLTVHESDSAAIIQTLKDCDTKWIFIAGYFNSMPTGVRGYIKDNFDTCQSTLGDPLTIFRRKTPAPKLEPVASR